MNIYTSKEVFNFIHSLFRVISYNCQQQKTCTIMDKLAINVRTFLPFPFYLISVYLILLRKEIYSDLHVPDMSKEILSSIKP